MTPHPVTRYTYYLHVDEQYAVITAVKCAVTCEINRQQYESTWKSSVKQHVTNPYPSVQLLGKKTCEWGVNVNL